jgi:CHAT domain-containing protein
MDQIDSSLYYDRRSLDIAVRLGDLERVSKTAYSACLCLWYHDEPERALQYCEQAMEAAAETGRWWEEENAANIVGNIYGGFDLGKSLAHYRRADSIAVENDDYVMHCYATSNTGIRWMQTGDGQKARPYFERALAIFDSVSEWKQDAWDLKGEPLLCLGWLAWVDGDTATAIRLAQESLDWAHELAPSPVGVYTAAHGLAYYHLESGNLEQADSLYQMSLAAAEEFGNKYFVRQGYAGLAEVTWRDGRREESLAQLDRSIQEIEAMREGLGSLEFREQWFASELWSYELMVRHRIEMGQYDEALAYFERMKARELLDLMTGGHVVPSQELSEAERAEEDRLIARIEDLNRRIAKDELGLESEIEAAHAEYDAFEDRLFRLHPGLRERRGKGQPLASREARELMDRDEVSLLYTLGPDHATVLVVARDGIRGHVLEEAGPVIRSRVQWLSDSIHSRSGPSGQAIAQELFKILIGPVEDIVRDKKRICVVPDGELYSVPFQALVDPKSGSYLIEEHSVYIAPSLSALASMRARESQDRPVLLAFGDPYFSRESRPGTLRSELAPLPFSGQEVESIADVYRTRAKVVTGHDASESAFKALAPDYGVIHVASHGLIDDRNPMHSSIAFSETDTEEDGFLEAREVMKLNLKADIVILSACETARGQVTRGEGVKGLLRSFFVAGVPTVVASLWPVEDESTAKLMSEFHRHLRKGRRPADAMARAQRKLLKDDARFRDSYYWAGFLVYGDSE